MGGKTLGESQCDEIYSAEGEPVERVSRSALAAGDQ